MEGCGRKRLPSLVPQLNGYLRVVFLMIWGRLTEQHCPVSEDIESRARDRADVPLILRLPSYVVLCRLSLKASAVIALSNDSS